MSLLILFWSNFIIYFRTSIQSSITLALNDFFVYISPFLLFCHFASSPFLSSLNIFSAFEVLSVRFSICRLIVKMAKKKSKRKPMASKKPIQPLDTQFNCPFCNHEKSCEVKIDRQRNAGRISCRICLEDYSTTITYLSEPIDVYTEWIDACETANS